MMFDRRRWLQTAVGSSLLFLAQPARSERKQLTAAKERSLRLYTLETGHQIDRGGPIVATKDNRVLWFTIDPEAPYLSPHIWASTRLLIHESRDLCKSWESPRVVAHGTPNYSVLSHVAFQLRGGDLVHMYVRFGGYDHIGHDPEKSSNPVFIQRSSDGGLTWGEGALLPTGERYISDVLSMTQISTGRVIYPFGYLTREKGQFKVSVLYSDDEARSWKRSSSVLGVGGTGFESGATEPSVVELPDGRLWMLIRAQTGFLWESFSSDGGTTWNPSRESRLPCSNAPGTALSLSSGKVVVVWNNHVDSAYARQSLVVAQTEDGSTFTGFREIDHIDFPEDPGERAAHVTYPFLAEAPEGSILVSYNAGFWLRHNRAKLARIDPDWIRPRREAEDFRSGRSGWCTTNPGLARTAAIERYAAPEDDAPGASLEIEQPDNSRKPCGITRNLPLAAECEMIITLSVPRPDAYLLWHDSLLAPGQIAEACLRVRFSKEGNVFLAAGTPTRTNADRKGLTYSYLAYPILKEQRYPQTIALGRRFQVKLRLSAAASKVWFRINDGPEVSLSIPPILALCHFGIAVAEGGLLRLRRYESVPSS